MFRYKTNKQAYIIAALVILLCLVCLTGATLALFTNNPNDGTIGIVTTTGDVSVDIVDLEGVTLKERSLQFVITSENTYKENVLFEPGAKFYTQGFKVKNDGTIPVQFTVSVSKDEKIDMEEFDKAFDVWIVEEDENGNKDFSGAQKLTKFKGELAVGKSSNTYFLLIKMKENVGNEFQGKTYTGIGVTVYAVQGNAQLS